MQEFTIVRMECLDDYINFRLYGDKKDHQGVMLVPRASSDHASEQILFHHSADCVALHGGRRVYADL